MAWRAPWRRAGHTLVRAEEVVWTNELAVREARRIADARPDVTIFNIPVWAFPHFSMIAARETPGPLLLFSNVDPQYPGMVGMLAAAGALDQIGRVYGRAWGDIADAGVRRSDRRARQRRRSDQRAARDHVRPYRRSANGHVHRCLESGPVDATSSALTSRRSTSGSSSGAARG